MKVSIVAHITPNTPIRLHPLLWTLGIKQFKNKFDLNIIDFTNNEKAILEQLSNYKSSFKWRLFSNEGTKELSECVDGDSLLFLPATCIPFKNALENIINQVGLVTRCKTAGPLFSLSTNNYSTNITQDMIDDCVNDVETDIQHISREDWIKPIDEYISFNRTEDMFVSILAGKECVHLSNLKWFRPESKVTLIKSNYVN